MKITHNKVGQNLNTKDTGKADKADKTKAAGNGASAGKAAALGDADLGATKVDLSPRAQDMKKAKEIAMATPDVDEAKVARLQKLIDGGNYKVAAKDIADKMVDEELSWSE
jgi:negative regulator of flagellin synthesis FlgM